MSASVIAAGRSAEPLSVRYVTCDTARVTALPQNDRRIAPPVAPEEQTARTSAQPPMSHTRETILEAF